MAEDGQAAQLQELQRLMLIGAILGLSVIPFSMIYRARVFASRHDINTDMVPVLFERFLKAKAFLDFLLDLNILAGCLIRGTRLETKAAAVALGAVYQLEEVANLLLMYGMGQVPFRYLVQKDDTSEPDVIFWDTLKSALGVGLLFMLPPLAGNVYGDNGLFFWFSDYKVEFWAFYWLALLISLVCVATFARVARVSERRRRRALRHVRYGDYFTRMTVEIAVVLAFDTALWLLPYALRTASWAHAHRHSGRRPRWCRLLDVYSVGFRGASNALVYVPKDTVVAVYRFFRRLFRGQQRQLQKQQWGDVEAGKPAAAGKEEEEEGGEENGNGTSSSSGGGAGGDSVHLMLLGPTRPLPFFTELPPPCLEERRVFVSTFNCGECGLQPLVGRLGEWIPKGMAVYVIGVQECLVMGGLKEAILDYLGHESYMCWDDAIGSTVTALGFHGMIGILVLARVEDVRAGRFMIYESQRQRVARGKNLGVARAQNKGGVGLAFRYHDLAFGCCGVHLASDSKGRSKLSQRLRDARDLLSMTSLWTEAYKDVDLQYQHHVTVFLGDVNFRMKRACPRRLLEDVAAVCAHEKADRHEGQSDWRRRAYEETVLSRGVQRRVPSSLAVVDLALAGGEGDEEQAAAGLELEEEEAECSSHVGGDEEEEDEDEDGDDDEEEEAPPKKGNVNGGMGNNTPQGGRVSFWGVRCRPSLLGASSHSRKSVLLQRETWEELLRDDELRQAMQAGDILHGFVEGEIRFPPTYRRIRGPAADAAAGDFTDPGALLTAAYSTVVHDKKSGGAGGLLKRRLAAMSSTSSTLPPRLRRPGGPRFGSLLAFSLQTTASSSAPSSSSSLTTLGGATAGATTTTNGTATTTTTTTTNGAGSSSSVEGASSSGSRPEEEAAAAPGAGAGEGRHSSIRIPSYTDRILFHVQRERRARVTLEAYESCDAIDSSDHKPVSSIISIRVDTGLTGLGSFLPLIRHHHSGVAPTTTTTTTTTIPSPSPSARAVPVPHTICSVQDAAFYRLRVTNVRADFSLGAARGLLPAEAAARPDHSMLQCPLSFEDAYRDLRRPAYVSQVCRQTAFLTAEARVNPFGYVCLKRWRDVEEGGYALVTCLRPEWGMHAAIFVRSGRVALGSAVIPLTDEDGRPLAVQRGLRVPTTRGSVHTGFFTCDVQLQQLAIPPRKHRVFA